ncbi:MAG: PKD domain-containing protein [bacterium]|nr:PKD domain-containing protein [bacterium]
MNKLRKRSDLATMVACGALALLLGACDTDSPTAPQHQAPAATPVPSTTWNITITASPNPIEIDGLSNATSSVQVSIRRSDNNQAPPDGAAVMLSTSYGTLTNASGTSTGTSVNLTLTSGYGSATLTVAGTQAGSLVLQAQLESSLTQATVVLVDAPEVEEEVLLIEDVSPSNGSPLGGDRVRITGTGFEEPVRVLFGGVLADLKSVSATRIVVTTPAIDLAVGQTSTVDVEVRVNVNQSDATSDILPGAFTYARDTDGGTILIPKIISITPTSGPNEGGTEVTIFGEGFADEVQVYFGTSAKIEAQVLDISTTRLLVVTPAATGFNSINQNSVVDVLVRNTQSGIETSVASAFQYGGGTGTLIELTAISQTEGLYSGGDIVTIYGLGFVDPVAVGMAGYGQSVHSVTGTEVVIRTSAVEITSCAEPSGDVSVTNIETGETNTGLSWTYRVLEPSIYSLNPSSTTIDITTRQIAAGAADQVVITGGGFDPPVRVIFGDDVSASVDQSSVTINSILADIPLFFEDFDTEACNDDGDEQEGERYLPTAVDVKVTNLPTDCEYSFTNAFYYYPSDQTCRDDAAPVEPDPPPVAAFVVNGPASGSTTVQFVDTSTDTDASATYDWYFGDSASLTGVGSGNRSHTYPPIADVTYDVTLVVTNSDGQTSTATGTVTIPP